MIEITGDQMPELLLIDINILGIGSMREYEFQHLAHRGQNTAAIHGACTKLAKLLRVNQSKTPVVLWDDRCEWRERILPQYKRHRWETPDQQAFLRSYLCQVEVIRALLNYLGLPQVSCPSFEADDIAGLICRQLDPDWQVTLATTDTDWYQALRKNVAWVSTRNGDVVRVTDLGNTDLVKGGPFLSTDHYVQAKALAGDSSDGIPGVKGLGLMTAAKIINEHGSIEALWAKYDAGSPLKGVALQRAAGLDYRDVYYRNMQLVDWRMAPRFDPNFLLEFADPNVSAFESLCSEWGLKAVAEAYKDFSVSRESAMSAVVQIRTILQAASSKASNDGIIAC